MKKLLVCLALLGMTAVPAFADIGRGQKPQMDLVPLGVGVENVANGQRNLPYTPSQEVYDNYPSQLGGPVPGQFIFGTGAGNWLFDDVKANTTLNATFDHVHWLMTGSNTGQLGGPVTPSGGVLRSQILGYFGDPTGNRTVHSGPLLTVIASAPAIFTVFLPVFSPGGTQFIDASFPGVVLPNGGDMYAGWLSFDRAAPWGTTIPNAGNGTSFLGASSSTTHVTTSTFFTTSTTQHTGTTTTTTTTTGGAVNVNVNTGVTITSTFTGTGTFTTTHITTSFFFTADGMKVPGAFSTGTTLGGPQTSGWPLFTTGNISFSLGFVPEPATIGVLALGGLLALRRRRA